MPVIIHAGTKQKIAIIDISSNMEDSYSRVVRNKIEVSIYSSSKYELVERNEIQVIIKEHGLLGSNFAKTGNAIKAGKFLSANFVITGSITFLDEYILNIKIIDVSKGNVLFVGSKNFTDKNDYIKYTLILIDEMKTAIEKPEEKEIEKKPVVKSRTFNLILSAGPSIPIFTWDSLAKVGYNIKFQAYIEWLNIPCITAGLSIGYVSNELKDIPGSAYGIPIMVSIGYSFRIKEILSIIPQFQAGANYSILQINDIKYQSFEPMIAPGLIISFNLSKNFRIVVSTDWSFIFETTGAVQNININAGIGVSI
jgi:hypothetical protein